MRESEKDVPFKEPGIGEEELARIFPEEDCWYEAILTLFRTGGNGEGNCIEEKQDYDLVVPNASAVGIKREKDTLFFELYEGSNSYHSVNENELVGINIPYGPDRVDTFIRASLKSQASGESAFIEDEFEIPENVPGRVVLLCGCSPRFIAKIMLIREMVKEDSIGIVGIKRVSVKLVEIKHNKDNNHDLWEAGGDIPYSRAEGFLMEALIAATRFRASGQCEQKELMEKHLDSAVRIGGKKTGDRARMIRDRVYSSSRIE